jgi:tetratricopeptide (TPR) repeat protein
MNQRLTRKEIKRDEFATAMERGVEYAGSHARSLIYAIAGVVLAGALAFGIHTFLGSRAERANQALAFAIKVQQAPITATGAPPDDPKEPTFSTEAARRARAKQLFAAIRQHYPFSGAADVAAVYLGHIALEEGQAGRARELWNGFVKAHGDHLLASEVRVNLLDLDRKEGKAAEVATQLKGMLEKEQPPLPKDLILFELAQTQEQLGQSQEAAKSYRRILDDYPRSAYRQTAQQKASALDPTHPAGAGGLPGMPGLGGL